MSDENERDAWRRPRPVDKKAAVAEARRILAEASSKAEQREQLRARGAHG